MIWLAIGLAGAAGAVCRYVVDFIVTARVETAFPFGTFLVNVSGSLLFGLVAGLAARHGLPEGLRLVVSGGFLGAYTTFSTFAYETLRLIEEGSRTQAALSALGSVGAGMAAATAGWAIAAAWSG